MIIAESIMEYDIKSSNTSIARENHLLPKEKCDYLDSLPKMDREVAIGLIKKDNEEYSKKEKEGLENAKKQFIEQNRIKIDEIISIKGDALFLKTYGVQNEWVGEYIHFRPKGKYYSYLLLDPIEIYHDKVNHHLDVKQMNDDTYEIYHSNYMGKFIENILNDMENGTPIRKKFVTFFDKYKNRELDVEYYREFNALSQFRYTDGSVTGETYQELSDIDISYNMKILASFMYNIIIKNFD